MAAYNALPQALGAIPCLEYYIARASNMQEAKGNGRPITSFPLP